MTRIPKRSLVLLLPILILGLLGMTGLVPHEQTLGSNLRLIYLHGTWVWTGIGAFTGSALAGGGALLFRRTGLDHLSRRLGWTGLAFWLTYLPMSLWVMQANWNGFFFDEPRWRVPFSLAIIAVLLQAGLLLLGSPRLTSAGNLVFGGIMLFRLVGIESVLHPTSPVFGARYGAIQSSYLLLQLTALTIGGLLTMLWPDGRNDTQEPV